MTCMTPAGEKRYMSIITVPPTQPTINLNLYFCFVNVLLMKEVEQRKPAPYSSSIAGFSQAHTGQIATRLHLKPFSSGSL